MTEHVARGAGRPLRVLWITNMWWEEGAASARGIFVTQAVDALRRLGGVEIDLELVAQGKGSLDYLGANPRVRERWDRGTYDLAHVHYGLTGLATLMLPTAAPLVFTFYGSDVNVPWQRTIAVATARRARRRIFVSRRLAERWPDDRNVVLPNGVDFEAVRPVPREEASRELGLDPATPRVLFGGRPDNEVKGWPLFEEVLGRVRARVPDVEPLVLSEPGQSYARTVAKLNAADVLLFTSRRGSEGSPTVVKEAAAAGLPVVSTDVGDAPEILDGVVPGGVIPWPADESAAARDAWVARLADAVSGVLEARKRSDGREKRGYLRLESIATRLRSIYEEVAAGR
ncbi:MAG: glycosyltransferase family 4 protein [Gemmatimonadetes bacterium]|nr:glycosyltransferase family 4 protein [Gemmatimonadota bacterium]